MIYDPFSIVVVPFPFTDSNQVKSRPALVLSSKDHQRQTEHITLLMITTAKNSTWYNDYVIQKLSGTGLSTSSIIRQKIFTIDLRLIKKIIGHLSKIDYMAVVDLLNQHIKT